MEFIPNLGCTGCTGCTGCLWNLYPVYTTKDASWAVSGGSFQEPVLGTPTSSDTDYILSIYFINSIRYPFKTVYLIINGILIK